MHIPTYFAILFLFICSTATAQIEDDLIGLYEEDELITIATGTAKEVRFAPSVATVITADDIKNTGARFLDDVLEMVPGMHMRAAREPEAAILTGLITSGPPLGSERSIHSATSSSASEFNRTCTVCARVRRGRSVPAVPR